MNAINSNLNSNSNSKIVTLCVVAFSILIGFTLSTLLKALSGAFGLIAQAMNYDWFKHGLPVVVALALFASLQFNSKFLVWADEVIAEIKKDYHISFCYCCKGFSIVTRHYDRLHEFISDAIVI